MPGSEESTRSLTEGMELSSFLKTAPQVSKTLKFDSVNDHEDGNTRDSDVDAEDYVEGKDHLNEVNEVDEDEEAEEAYETASEHGDSDDEQDTAINIEISSPVATLTDQCISSPSVLIPTSFEESINSHVDDNSVVVNDNNETVINHKDIVVEPFLEVNPVSKLNRTVVTTANVNPSRFLKHLLYGHPAHAYQQLTSRNLSKRDFSGSSTASNEYQNEGFLSKRQSSNSSSKNLSSKVKNRTRIPSLSTPSTSSSSFLNNFSSLTTSSTSSNSTQSDSNYSRNIYNRLEPVDYSQVTGNPTDDDATSDAYFSDISWLMAGYGKWNQSSLANNNQHASGTSSYSNIAASIANVYNQTMNTSDNTSKDTSTVNSVGNAYNRPKSANLSTGSSTTQLSSTSNNHLALQQPSSIQRPSAQISMTSPRISVDIGNDAGSYFILGNQILSQWRGDESTYLSANPSTNATTSSNSSVSLSGPIKVLTVNDNESLLLSSGKSGIRLWSLNTNSYPTTPVGDYPNTSTTIPHSVCFLKNNLQFVSCDGSVTVWDIESSRILSFLHGNSNNSSHSMSSYNNSTSSGNNPYYHSISVIPARHGVSPGIQGYGDYQILTTCNHNDIHHYDLRIKSCQHMNSNRYTVKPCSQWVLPSLPSLSSMNYSNTFGVSSSNDWNNVNHLNHAICDDKYIYSSSTHGGIWIIDRRNGKVLSSYQGHDSSIVKMQVLDDYHFISISEKSGCIWSVKTLCDNQVKSMDNSIGKSSNNSCDLESVSPIRVFNVKNIPESSSVPLTSNTTIIHSFANSKFASLSSENRSLQQLNVMYAMSGHKVFSGKMKIRSFDDYSYLVSVISLFTMYLFLYLSIHGHVYRIINIQLINLHIATR